MFDQNGRSGSGTVLPLPITASTSLNLTQTQMSVHSLQTNVHLKGVMLRNTSHFIFLIDWSNVIDELIRSYSNLWWLILLNCELQAIQLHKLS